MKNPVETIPDTDAARRRFAALLWRAFPSASENELSEKAARALNVHPRTVRLWLRGEHCAAARHVFAVVAIAGAEIVFSAVSGARP